MKKKLVSFMFFSFLLFDLEGQNQTFLYPDTFIVDQELKIHVTQIKSWPNGARMLLSITNLTDSFRIISPEDIICTVSPTLSVPSEGTTKCVIPPKGSSQLKLHFEGPDLMADALMITILNVWNAGKAKTIYTLPDVIIDREMVDKIKHKYKPTYSSGPITITILDANYKKKTILFNIRVAYSGDNFLGIQTSQMQLKENTGNILVNSNRNERFLYFHSKYKSQKHIVFFESSSDKNIIGRKDKLMFPEVFTEYAMTKSKTSIKFNLYKDSQGKRVDLGNKKEKDIALPD